MQGSDLKSWRKQYGLTQSDLAIELEVSRQTVVGWEASGSLPKILMLALRELERNRSTAGKRMSASQQRDTRQRPDEPGTSLPIEKIEANKNSSSPSDLA
jgi:DNA-binding XRE family transcriptional regulator